MRHMKKAILCLILTVSLCLGLNVSSLADLSYQNFNYEIVGDSVTVTGYTGTLESVSLPLTIDGRPVTAIADRAFQNTVGLRFISLAEDGVSYLESIGTQAFAGCTSLARIAIPGSVTSVGDFAFSGCKAITELSVASAATTLGICAFADCTGLKAVSVPCYHIGYGAFRGCSNLSDVQLSASVRQVGQNAFADTALWKTAENGAVYIGSLLYGYKGTAQTLEVLAGTHCIADYALAGVGLREVILPDSIYRVGQGAFADNPSLTSVCVPASVTAIGDNAFPTENDGFLLYCADGSAAQVYARENGVAYELTDNCTHAFGDWTTITAVTCVEDGLRARRCVRCNYVEEERLPSPGHDFGTGVIHPEPTCTTDGKRTRTCAVCGTVETETLPALGHTWLAWSVTREPSCSEEGVRMRVCAVCGVQDAESIASLPHTWIVNENTDADGYAVVQPPACTSPGAKQRVCAVCGGTETAEIPETGHSVSTWTTEKAPTAATKGVEKGVCANCGQTVTRYTDKLPSVLPRNAYRLELENGSPLVFGNEFAENGDGYLIAPEKMPIGDCLLGLKNAGFLIVTDGQGNRYDDTDAYIGTGKIISLVQDPNAPLDRVNIIDYTVVMVLGDENGDGRVTAADARTALRISARLQGTTMIGFRACDINGDDRLTAAEARTILRVSAKLQTFDGTPIVPDEPESELTTEVETIPEIVSLPEEFTEEAS